MQLPAVEPRNRTRTSETPIITCCQYCPYRVYTSVAVTFGTYAWVQGALLRCLSIADSCFPLGACRSLSDRVASLDRLRDHQYSTSITISCTRPAQEPARILNSPGVPNQSPAFAFLPHGSMRPTAAWRTKTQEVSIAYAIKAPGSQQILGCIDSSHAHP